MRFYCPVTGLETSSNHFLPSTKTQVTGLHPVIALSLTQLNKLNHNDNKAGKITDFDAQLLFCAYLYKTKMVTYTAPLSPSDIPVSLVYRYFETVYKLANTNYKLDNLPKFHASLETDLTGLKTWLDMMRDAVTVGGTYFTNNVGKGETLTDISQQLADELEARKKHRKQIALAKKNREVSITSIKKWAILEVGIHSNNSQAIELTERVFARPDLFPVNALKQVKYFLLDTLPESQHYHVSKKDEIIEYLNKLILDKSELALLFSDSEEETAKIREDITEVSQSYVIHRDGEEYVNSASNVANRIGDILDNAVANKEITAVANPIAKPTAPPQRSDYSNAMAYNLALAKYNGSLK